MTYILSRRSGEWRPSLEASADPAPPSRLGGGEDFVARSLSLDSAPYAIGSEPFRSYIDLGCLITPQAYMTARDDCDSSQNVEGETSIIARLSHDAPA